MISASVIWLFTPALGRMISLGIERFMGLTVKNLIRKKSRTVRTSISEVMFKGSCSSLTELFLLIEIIVNSLVRLYLEKVVWGCLQK
jgi:hypothetical protein